MHQQLFSYHEAFCKHIKAGQSTQGRALTSHLHTKTPSKPLRFLPHPDNISPLSGFASISPFCWKGEEVQPVPTTPKSTFINSIARSWISSMYYINSSPLPQTVWTDLGVRGDRQIQKQQFSGYERKRVGKLPKKGLTQVNTGGSALYRCGRKQLHVTY